jgi:hypothetical protein
MNTYTYAHTIENGARQRPVEPIPEDRQRGRLDLNVFFDVLDTLLTEEDTPRPHAREAFLRLKEAGHEVYLWSSGGGAYAAAAAEVLGVADLVAGCIGKRHEPDVPVDFAVDDDLSVVESYGGYRVEPFGGDPGDEELLRAAEAMGASQLGFC